MKKLRIVILAMVAVLCLAACNNKPGPTPPPVPPVDGPVYGLPVAATGYYIKDADLVENGDTRHLIYTTNGESAEEYNVIAACSAAYDGTGWEYGEEHIVLEGETGGWDEYLSSASIVKGVFAYGNTAYSWLMAYAATSNANDTDNEIGLAVANSVLGPWVKVGTRSLISYDEQVYGPYVGCYAPSLVNLDRQSKVRIYYTYADAYGHFAQFVDINAAELDLLYTDEAAEDVTLISGAAQLPVNGGLNMGDGMFPNADFAHDATNGKVYAVKDYSPAAALKPNFAEKVELGCIAESELYSIAQGNGWTSVVELDMFSTPDTMYERLYSACVVSDAYGHVDGAGTFEIVYTVCDIEKDNADWMFSQNLLSYVHEPVEAE